MASAIRPSVVPTRSSSESTSPRPSSDAANKPNQPKLRASCDACSAAKVKCSKDHPRCERCISNRLVCVYGISRKFGKLPNRRRHADTQNERPLTRDLAPNGAVPRRHSSMPTTAIPPQQPLPQQFRHMQSFGVDFNFENVMVDSWNTNAMAPAAWPVNNSLQWNHPPHSHHNSVSSMDIDMSSLHHNNVDQINTIPNSSFDDFNSFVPPLQNTPFFEMNATPPIDMAPSDHVPDLFDDRKQMNVCLSPSTMRSWNASDSSLGLGSASPDEFDFHECKLQASDILGRLHRCRTRPFDGRPGTRSSSRSMSNCSVASSVPSPSQNGQQDSSALPFDEVLRVNRTAVRQIARLLQCQTCRRDPHLAMLYAAILSQIIGHYQALAGIKANAFPPSLLGVPTVQKSGHSTPQSEVSSAHDYTSLDSHAAAQYGAFALEDEDHETLRRALLMSELRKTGQLIDQMAMLGTDDGFDSVHQVDSDIADLYTSLSSWLRAEVQRTLARVMRGNMK